jgi:hypothetical protein
MTSPPPDRDPYLPAPVEPVPFSPPQSPPYGYPPPVYVQPVAPSSGVAVASLIFGILGLVTGCCNFGLFPLVAIICGHFAMRDTRDGRMSGRSQAMAGLILGYIGIIPAAIFSAIVVIGRFVQAAHGH